MKRTQDPEGFGEIMGEISRHLPWPVAGFVGCLAFAVALPWLVAHAAGNAYRNGRYDTWLPAWVKRRRDDKIWAGWSEFTRRVARGADPERWGGKG